MHILNTAPARHPIKQLPFKFVTEITGSKQHADILYNDNQTAPDEVIVNSSERRMISEALLIILWC